MHTRIAEEIYRVLLRMSSSVKPWELHTTYDTSGCTVAVSGRPRARSKRRSILLRLSETY